MFMNEGMWACGYKKIFSFVAIIGKVLVNEIIFNVSVIEGIRKYFMHVFITSKSISSFT